MLLYCVLCIVIRKFLQEIEARLFTKKRKFGVRDAALTDQHRKSLDKEAAAIDVHARGEKLGEHGGWLAPSFD